MSATAKKAGFALLVDVMGSSRVDDFSRQRDLRLDRMSERHTTFERTNAPYTVTAWDEFQTYTWKPREVPRIILELRQGFRPWDLRIGVGAGEITGWRRRPINEAVGGAAFERAREALQTLQTASYKKPASSQPGSYRSRDKYPRLTRFRTGDEAYDELLDLIYGLHDTLVQEVTERQWATITYALDGDSQEMIARAMRVNTSTVSRNLRRGHYWQMRDTADLVAELLDEMTKPA